MELLFNVLGGIEISISMADTRLWPSERHNRGLMYCRQYGTVYRFVYIYIYIKLGIRTQYRELHSSYEEQMLNVFWDEHLNLY